MSGPGEIEREIAEFLEERAHTPLAGVRLFVGTMMVDDIGGAELARWMDAAKAGGVSMDEAVTQACARAATRLARMAMSETRAAEMPVSFLVYIVRHAPPEPGPDGKPIVRAVLAERLAFLLEPDGRGPEAREGRMYAQLDQSIRTSLDATRALASRELDLFRFLSDGWRESLHKQHQLVIENVAFREEQASLAAERDARTRNSQMWGIVAKMLADYGPAYLAQAMAGKDGAQAPMDVELSIAFNILKQLDEKRFGKIFELLPQEAKAAVGFTQGNEVKAADINGPVVGPLIARLMWSVPEETARKILELLGPADGPDKPNAFQRAWLSIWRRRETTADALVERAQADVAQLAGADEPAKLLP
jgi:hypothetical protein